MHKLVDRLAAEFAYFGLASHPLNRSLFAIIRASQWAWWKWLGIAIFVSFVAGFGLCMAWYGAQVTVLQSTVAVWKTQYDAEHVKHHAKETKPVSKAAAQVIVQRLQDEREMKDRE